ARCGRDRQLGPKADTQGFYGGAEPFGERRRRPRHAVLRELLLPLVTQLYRLQSRGGCVDRPAVGGNRHGQTQGAGLADRAQADRGCGAPDHFFMRQGTCWQPEVKGLTLMENSIFNSWRMEDVWLDR